jgi:hypothetical protein
MESKNNRDHNKASIRNHNQTTPHQEDSEPKLTKRP